MAAKKEKPSRRFYGGKTVAKREAEWEARDALRELRYFIRDGALSLFVHSDPPLSAAEAVDNIESLVAELHERGHFARVPALASERRSIPNPRPRRKAK